ncbi:hypothetical protein [Bacillus haynesii]|uniref:hypothetical protein n=1 Tax=Bacillus haynesii TaxID=1925021 RepID=UPI000B9D5116|nr:hypothetical protein [Bacillus haynesii]
MFILKGVRLSLKTKADGGIHTNAAGNPDWLRTHEPAEKNAEAVDLLLGLKSTCYLYKYERKHMLRIFSALICFLLASNIVNW